MAEKNEYINEAYQILKSISEDERKRHEYESREKAIRDHNHILYIAKKAEEQRDQALAEGIKEGKKEGIKEGIETGLKIFIQYNLEQGIFHEQIIENLQNRFHLDYDSANKYYEKYK